MGGLVQPEPDDLFERAFGPKAVAARAFIEGGAEPAAPRKLRRAPPDAFERFWRAYPRKTAKAAAERALRRLDPCAETLERMLQAVAAHRESEQWKRDGGRYIPHPATWINQGRWEDEQPGAAEPAIDPFKGAL